MIFCPKCVISSPTHVSVMSHPRKILDIKCVPWRVNDGKNGMCGKASHEERLLLRVSSYALAQDVLSSAEFQSHVILTLPKTEY